MTKTDLKMGDDDWFLSVFSETEIRELSDVTERVMSEYDEPLQVTFLVGPTEIHDVLKFCHQTSLGGETILDNVGNALCDEYFENDAVVATDSSREAFRYFKAELLELDDDDEGDE